MRLSEFLLNPNVLASEIYAGAQHITTPAGLAIPEYVRTKLGEFLAQFIVHAQIPLDLHPFLRIDAFFDEHALHIIEINVETREGWGIALNLLHAAGHLLDQNLALLLPREFITFPSSKYIPEYELAAREAQRYGVEIRHRPYTQKEVGMGTYPYSNKLYLADFSRVWNGTCVHIPPIFHHPHVIWENIPEAVVFKFCNKLSPECQAAGYSVATRAQINRGKHMRRCYTNRNAIAQALIPPALTAGNQVCQAIIMCAGATPVTGYLQVAPAGTFIINDKTAAKGPLIFT